MTEAKFRAPDDGGGTDALGAGLQRLGRSASSFAEAWSERDAMRDEAKTRKADNALVDSWQALSEPHFGASGEAAVRTAPAARQSLDDEIGRQRGTLDNDRQRGMFDQVAKLRRDEWLSRIGQHEDGAVADFDETESQRRQELAVGSMAAAAGKDYGPGVVANVQVLLGEVDGRSRRRGLDEAGAHQARVQALAAARARVVEQLADVDPGKAQAWLDTHRADIGDPATLERLDRMLRPFVEEQRAERIADEIRTGTSGLDAQIAGVDGRELSPDLAAAVKGTLQRRARGDEAVTADAQKQAADKAWSIALDPAATSLRTIPPMLYATLAPGEQGAIRQAIGANARMEDPAPDPALYLALADKAALGVLTIDDVRHAWGRLPRDQWAMIAGWQSDLAESGGTRATAEAGGHMPVQMAAPFLAPSDTGSDILPGFDHALYVRSGDGRMAQTTDAGPSADAPLFQAAADRRVPPYMSSIHGEIIQNSAKYPPDAGTREWTWGDLAAWQLAGGDIDHFRSQWVHGYRRAIIAAAKQFDLPVALVAGIAYEEVGGGPLQIDSAADTIRAQEGRRFPFLEKYLNRPRDKTSFGDLSMQVRRAAASLGYGDPSDTQRRVIIESLQNPGASIFIAAKHLSDLRNIDHKGVSAAKLTPQQIEEIAARYNRGPDVPLSELRRSMSYGRKVMDRSKLVEKLMK